MPRLLRDGEVVTDDWQYAGAETTAGTRRVILPLERWRSEREAWLAGAGAGALGVLLAPADKVEVLAADLGALSLVALEFPGPSDGRGYSQARLLRERWGFRGELRAVGYVRQDQLFFLARCGFNAFELPEPDLEAARGAFATFSAAYQASNDAGLPFTLHHRV